MTILPDVQCRPIYGPSRPHYREIQASDLQMIQRRCLGTLMQGLPGLPNYRVVRGAKDYDAFLGIHVCSGDEIRAIHYAYDINDPDKENRWKITCLIKVRDDVEEGDLNTLEELLGGPIWVTLVDEDQIRDYE